MSEAAQRIEIRSELAELHRLLAFIDGFCARFAVPDETKYKVFLVVEELTVNAIGHGYGGDPGGRIEIGLERGDRELVATVEDGAPPFDCLAGATSPDLSAPLEDRGIGGLGLHFVRTLSTTAEYRYESGRNVVRTTFADVG